jgi:hypothetical protein
MGELIHITKETQAKQGLKYTLTAERVSKDVVLVQMEIPREGKLKDIRSISMSIGRRKAVDEGSPMLAAPLHIRTGKNDSRIVSFQLTSDLADRCSIDLWMPYVDLSYDVYAVELKGYITDRK